MIVVDSSVWIAHLRQTDTNAVHLLRELVDTASGEIIVGDLVLLELLQGARNETHARAIERALRRFTVSPMLSVDLAVRAAAHDRTLRGLGVSVRKMADMIIATFCLEHDHVLLHQDRDFAPMVRHLGLRVI